METKMACQLGWGIADHMTLLPWQHFEPLAHIHTQSWEEKHVAVSLDADGFAGFSVVGGRDQPQLPNPGAFIITTVNQGGPADGELKWVFQYFRRALFCSLN